MHFAQTQVFFKATPYYNMRTAQNKTLSNNVKKVLVSVAIGDILLRLGGQRLFDDVHRKVAEEHACDSCEIYKEPKLVLSTLNGSFHSTYRDTISLIKKEFADFACQEALLRQIASSRAA